MFLVGVLLFVGHFTVQLLCLFIEGRPICWFHDTIKSTQIPIHELTRHKIRIFCYLEKVSHNKRWKRYSSDKKEASIWLFWEAQSCAHGCRFACCIFQVFCHAEQTSRVKNKLKKAWRKLIMSPISKVTQWFHIKVITRMHDANMIAGHKKIIMIKNIMIKSSMMIITANIVNIIITAKESMLTQWGL